MIRYNVSTCTAEMSVSTLCEIGARSGDLDRRHGMGKLNMHIGSEIHRRLQSEAGAQYEAEVSLCNTTLYGGMYYTVSGRADGIIKTASGIVVDEIKTVHGYQFFMPPSTAHLAQLKCYAYFLSVREDLEFVRARLTYFNTDNDKIKYFEFTFSAFQLKEFYLGLISEVSFFAELVAKRTLDVIPAAASAVFPYGELREGQEMMIRECYGAIKRGQRLFVEAPTGTGKTISSLFPAVRALGAGFADKVFYLTAKASTRREAYSAASKIFSSCTPIRAVVLSAKESMCRCSSQVLNTPRKNRCNPEECPYAKGYYDRVNGALRELLSSSNGYPIKTVLAMAEKHRVCPYELSLDLSEYCDVIICDYNYVFDPAVYLRRYFSDTGRREKYVFLIDEAHNLADRARDMYSATLRRSNIEALISPENDGDLGGALESLWNAMTETRRLCKDSLVKDSEGNERGFFISRSPLTSFLGSLEAFKKKCEGWLRKNEAHALYDEVYELVSQIRKFECVNEYFDKGFLSYVEISGGDVLVKTYCLDPSAVMNTLLERGVASVMFSATLTPAEYFCDVLGKSEKNVSITLPSPFDSENLCVAVADYVSTRYEDRASNVMKYVSAIAATVSAKAGNYVAYFPSYDCMDKVYVAFCRKYPQVSTVVQKRSMSHADRESFLNSFKEGEGGLHVGFCVLGGVFSEGVDLPGSRLIGAIIIGVGLPGLSNERNIIREYFDEDDGSGYDYAYTYPGMNNVLQAAGRVIRTENDAGVVVLVDDRYATPKYRQLFPQHWKNVQYAGNAASLAEISRRFWLNRG